jgi:hypothetical protein
VAVVVCGENGGGENGEAFFVATRRFVVILAIAAAVAGRFLLRLQQLRQLQSVFLLRKLREIPLP